MLNEDRKQALIGAIDAAEESAYSSDTDGDLANDRARNIDRYLGRNIFPAPDGRSQVTDRSVYEVVQGMMPSLSRIFAPGDDIIELPPVGREDEQGAKQEAQYLNYILLQKNNWFEIFDTAAKDALLTKTGYLHPYAEKRIVPEIERYERQTPESLALLMQDEPTVVSVKEYPDPDYKPQPQPVPDPMTGQPAIGPDGQPVMMVPPPPMLYDIEIRRTKEETAFCIEVFPPERCKIAESCKTVQLRDCTYFEYFDFPTVSELRQLGYKLPDDLNFGAGETADTLEDTARDQFGEKSWDESNPRDPSMKRVKCRWIWIRHDFDEDGIAELQYVVRVGQEILHREEVSRIPVAVLCPDKLPHRHIGLCPADAVSEIQDIKTAIIRNGLDNLYFSNNPLKFADGKYVNLDDLGVSRPGMTVRLKAGAVFGQNFGVMPIPFVFPQAMEALAYMDQVKQERSGISEYFTGLDQNALNKTATGIQQLSTMAAQRVEQIARHFANGITELASLLHEVILKSGHKKDTVKLRGQWVDVDPASWRTRTDFRISVGFAAGNKDAMVSRLMMIAQMQEKAMMGGLPIVNPRNAYETAIELTKASDLQAPERFWQDPANAPPPSPPQPDVTVVAAEQIKSQTTLQVKDAELRTEKETTAAELQAEREKAELEAQTKLAIAQMQAQHAHELERVRGEQSAQLEGVRAHLNPKTKEAEAKASEVKQKDTFIQQAMENQKAVMETLKQISESLGKMNGPKQIVRGKDGRASHVVPVE